MVMMLLVLLAVAGPPKGPEQHPALAETLAVLDRDSVQVQAPDLDVHERARLAVEIREQGAKVPALTVAEPPPVQQLARTVEQRTARLVAAMGKNDPDATGREAGQLQVQVSKLRAAVAP
jgi:hypothetical protein